MRIKVELNDETVRKAASIVMKHYSDEEFLKRIRNVSRFNHTGATSDMVAQEISMVGKVIEMKIVGFQSKWPWSKSIGYAKNGTYFLNTRKTLPLNDRVANIFHESLHLLGFEHKGNYVTTYNLKTVPYLASAIFAKYVSEIYGE